MLRKLSKKHLAAIAFVGVLAITGVSVAYFTGGAGSATGSGTVGSSSAWGVATGTPAWSGSLTALYPGAASDTELIPFTVTNNGHGNQSMTSIVPTMPTSGNDVTSTAGDIPGCLATWFHVALDANNAALPSSLAPGATYTGKVDLTMSESGTNQNACQGAAPVVTVTAS